MTRTGTHDYKVVPAPRAGRRIRGVRDRDEAFALTLQEILAEQAAEGWEYLRADSLPCEERAGWFGGREQSLRTVLIFRRPRPGAALAAGPAALHAAPPPAAGAPAPIADPDRAFAAAPRPPAPADEPVLRAPRPSPDDPYRLVPSPDPHRAEPGLHPDPEAPAPRLGPAER